MTDSFQYTFNRQRYQAATNESYRRPPKKTNTKPAKPIVDQSVKEEVPVHKPVVSPEVSIAQTPPLNIEEKLPHVQTEASELDHDNINPKVPGRGKREHTYLQELIRNLGMEYGYKSVVEAPLNDGGFIDVLLTRDDERIAFEVALNTANVYELHNIRKSLDDGIENIVIVSNKPKHLAALEQRAKTELTKKQFTYLRFISPELIPEIITRQEDTTERVRGYKVKVRRIIPSANEIRSKREKVASILAGV